MTSGRAHTWCAVGRAKKNHPGNLNLNPRHYSFWKWGYDECPICGKTLGRGRNE